MVEESPERFTALANVLELDVMMFDTCQLMSVEDLWILILETLDNEFH